MIQGATQQMLSAVNEIIIKARSLHKGIHPSHVMVPLFYEE